MPGDWTDLGLVATTPATRLTNGGTYLFESRDEMKAGFAEVNARIDAQAARIDAQGDCIDA